jgi:hypothetical protein
VKARIDGVECVLEPMSHRVFFSVFLPLGAIANVGLGVFVLSGVRPDGELNWLQLGTGAICCMIAGWLAAIAWSKSYWHRSMARQVAVWRSIADALFIWVEELHVPVEALLRLRTSLEKAVPTMEQN